MREKRMVERGPRKSGREEFGEMRGGRKQQGMRSLVRGS